MTLQWIITGVLLVVALLAWSRARRAARRVEQLSQMYWELKYQHGELRAQLHRLTGETAAHQMPAPTGQSVDAFVPLASLKR